MAKARRKARGDGISGYFRKVFQEHPEYLYSKSNDDIRKRWLADNPGHAELPKRVVQNLNNVKSLLRRKGRDAAQGPEKAAARAYQRESRGGGRGLEHLEENIDECLILAKNMDREGLAKVIHHLREARNAVVWKQGGDAM